MAERQFMFSFDGGDSRRKKKKIIGAPEDVSEEHWRTLEGFEEPAINWEASKKAGLSHYPCPWRFATIWEQQGFIEKTGKKRRSPKSGSRTQWEKVVTDRGRAILAWRRKLS